MESSLEALRRLAARYGVATRYRDGLGREHRASPETLAAILNALGCDVDSPMDALQDPRTLPDAAVLFGTEAAAITLNRPAGEGAVLELEDGSEMQIPVDGGTVAVPAGIPAGRHTLHLGAERCLVLAAPATTFPPEQKFPAPSWGLFLPLYATRAGDGRPVGDLADLEWLMDWTGSLGGQMVGVLPLNAAFLDRPYSPSPYSPASRLFWNELFLDVPGSEGTPGTADVDYRAAMAGKRKLLEASPLPEDAIRSRVEADPYLLPYARFRAETEERSAGWRQWPETVRSGRLTVADDHPAVRYHLDVQTRFHRRMSGILAQERPGRALYLDLPLGVHPDGFDTFIHPSLFATGVTVGCPPDPMFIGGQDWGFPPLLPAANRQERYRYLGEVFGRQARYASLLRIDHVQGFHRQFWIPAGADPSQGTYVRYPEREIYAVLNLESHRHRCAVAGEDLGVVPDEVRDSMAAHQLQRLYVGQYQHPPETPPPRSVASLNTHDLRPLAGFVRGLDIDDRLDYRLWGPEEATQARKERDRTIRQVADALGVAPDPAALLPAWLEWLASSPARFVLVNAEDLWLESRAQNVPGTPDSRPNWVGRAALSLEDMEQSERITGLLRRLSARRAGGKERG